MGICVRNCCSSSANAFAEELAVCNYQVFLSFRGPDVRRNFLECFSDHLTGSGFIVFTDREEIEYGERIDTKIVEAIKRSDVCIPILSNNFASSPACLMEVAQMVESEKTILPIFYGVKPGVVCRQQGTYGESFVDQEKRSDTETISKWKTSLANVAGIKGFELEDVSSGYHELLRNVVSKLWQLLEMGKEDVTENLVGIHSNVQEMMRKLGVHNVDGQVAEGRCVVAVCGLPGVGKTTLAKVVYNKISHLFDACSFLKDVRAETAQKNLVSLQNKLIRDLKRGNFQEVKFSDQGTKVIKCLFRRKRVLIVLDDVDDFEQIKPLAENLTWFGPGSRIILTTRRKDVIKHYKIQEINEHEVLPMNENHALELFCKHAFRPGHPDDYGSLPTEIISAVGKLPFAIEIVGSYLNGKSPEIWRETLDKLKGELEKGVEPMLKASYDLLDENTKEIFLDIACFFIGVDKTIPYYMWEARKRFPNRGVHELQNMSFIKISEAKEFWMHDQLKILGRELVKKENPKNPGKRSRLWDYKDVQTTLRKKKCTENVEALRVTPNYNQDEPDCNCLHYDDFHHLSNLKFLELTNVGIEGNPENLLLSNLLWLDWHGCPEKSNLFALDMKKLVILNLCSSRVTLNLEDWEKLMLNAGSLKVLNLKGCPWITASLGFPNSMSLECLILEGCLLATSTIDESISRLENLVSLNMKHCLSVKHLPQALCSLKALKELLIDGTKIERLHFEEGSLPALEILSACECEVLGEVTESIGLLKNLQKLTLRSCRQLKGLPHFIGKLVWLRQMDLSYTLINELPSSVKDLKNLQVLKMVHTYLEGFPEAIKDLEKLQELDFTHCESLSGDCDITGLSSLRILRLKCTRISRVLARDHRQLSLYILELDDGVDKQTVS
ncbi:disease resistance protein RUN1-like [Syzygium oleosum]|uniref:disease resistance protein RUN1-like n=1 Tax=Syzygium oleosum TaxID=219896 RepID=UPI0011D27A48|nr:disease resistance protein RUN1-like [Syzygium oleosum]